MKEQPEARAVILGEYIVRQKATVRAAAEWFGVSKSTVHKDVSERLEQIQPDLYTQVKEILEQNKQERHIRGGLATKRKYALRRQHEENLYSRTHLKPASAAAHVKRKQFEKALQFRNCFVFTSSPNYDMIIVER
ncbi:MAG: sporulation transcriptional regulator SpoIIID [Ruminococcus callidus]